ncbi:hypothetical protein [Actinoplanes sp. NPDC048796]
MLTLPSALKVKVKLESQSMIHAFDDRCRRAVPPDTLSAMALPT